MIARSLRLRLLIGAGAAIAAALTVAWLTMGYLFEAHIERSVEEGLVQDGRDLVAGLTEDTRGALQVNAPPADPRYEQPASGLYWQISRAGYVLRSRSLWDEALANHQGASAHEWNTGDIAGPFGQRVVFVSREIRLSEVGAPIVVLLAANHAAVTQARTQFSRELALFLAILWLVLSAAAWLQVHLGLRPLRDVREALMHMKGRPEARLRDSDYPAEAAPLAQAINALADARERELESARKRAADLAHSLKTPLAAIAAQSRRARESGAGDAADGLDKAVEAARSALERELTRTRLAGERDAQVRAAVVIDRLIAVIERTEEGYRRSFENCLGETILPVSEGALMELAGPLLENAARHARTRVRISGGHRFLCIEDDGAGLSPASAAEALGRGKRLDESGEGHGLGLAIARDVSSWSGANLTLARSPLGGLRVEVRWAEAPAQSAS